MNNWKKTIVKDQISLGEVIKNLNKSGLRICLVEDKNRNFLGTVTDGDIRRGLIDGLKLSDKINRIINLKCRYVDENCSKLIANKIMKKKKIFHLPIIKNNKLHGLHFYEFEKQNKIKKINNTFVINAGGRGIRLKPITNIIPKPMIKIDGRPMIEHIILKAKNEGFINFIIIVHYLKDKIINFLKNGTKYGIKITYVHEKTPLGTAGGLSLLNNQVSEDFIFSNSDVLSQFNFKEFLEFHCQKKSLISIAIKNIVVKENYGLVNVKKDKVISIKEKPLTNKFINCGIYSMNKRILQNCSKNQKIDMIEFLNKIKLKNKKIYAFPVHETWRDLSLKKYIKGIKNK